MIIGYRCHVSKFIALTLLNLFDLFLHRFYSHRFFGVFFLRGERDDVIS